MVSDHPHPSAIFLAQFGIGVGLLFLIFTVIAGEADLWTGFSSGEVTLRRALVAQIYAFVPFLFFAVAPYWLLKRYFDRLPTEPDSSSAR